MDTFGSPIRLIYDLYLWLVRAGAHMPIIKAYPSLFPHSPRAGWRVVTLSGPTVSADQYYMNLARAVDAQGKRQLDVGGAAGAGDQRQVAAVGEDIRPLSCLDMCQRLAQAAH